MEGPLLISTSLPMYMGVKLELISWICSASSLILVVYLNPKWGPHMSTVRLFPPGRSRDLAALNSVLWNRQTREQMALIDLIAIVLEMQYVFSIVVTLQDLKDKMNYYLNSLLTNADDTSEIPPKSIHTFQRKSPTDQRTFSSLGMVILEPAIAFHCNLFLWINMDMTQIVCLYGNNRSLLKKILEYPFRKPLFVPNFPSVVCVRNNQ